MTDPSDPSRGSARAELARRQAELVAAMVAGGQLPAGFDKDMVEVARRALLRKRAGEVAGTWPALAASVGPQWIEAFARWADGRPGNGSLRDGWDFARELAAGGVAGASLPAAAEAELAEREAVWRYDGQSAPRRRRLALLRPVLRRFLPI
jgi:hypothetical protein